MVSADTSRLALRFLALAPIPPAIGLGVVYVAWWLFYLSVPIFFPFLAYEYSCSNIGVRGGETVFHDYGWHWSGAYLAAIAAATAALTFRKPFVMSLAVLPLVTIVLGTLVHVILNALGFCYWLDTP
jgi:hypothetical protein